MMIYFFRYSAIFISNFFDNDAHRHHLMEIFISLGDKICIKKDNQCYELKNMIIDSDEIHKLESSNNNTILVLALDSESITTRKLKKIYLNDNGISILPDSLFLPFQIDFKKLLNSNCKIEEAKEIHDKIVNYLLRGNNVEVKKLDLRIEKTLLLLQQFPGKKIKIRELANKITLSPSRLIHLFTVQIGISLRHYLLWLKILNAINLIIQGSTFTDSAYEAGFSDSAHLSRTFKKMFGFKLRVFFKNYKNSRYVQVKTEKF